RHPDPARQDGDVGDEADLVHQLVARHARVLAQYRKLALERGQAEDGLQRRGLAGTVGADQADDAARLDGEADFVQRRLAAVLLAEVAGDDGAHSTPALPRAASIWLRRLSQESPSRTMRSTI